MAYFFYRRRALALIRLDSPSEVVKRVSRTQQKYDVTAAEWNPTQSQGHTFVLAVSFWELVHYAGLGGSTDHSIKIIVLRIPGSSALAIWYITHKKYVKI